MHISITDDLKKQFHAACTLHGQKMSQVVVETIEQWLKANAIQPSNELHEKNCCELEFGDSISDMTVVAKNYIVSSERLILRLQFLLRAGSRGKEGFPVSA
ncbi:MAG: hypothetical protein V7L20_18440 [Nostoc sp.]|uniref:hypothetical protein n=1 Tax=Nostoc sp. TaxID=1180 RepID=UPI002FF7D29A